MQPQSRGGGDSCRNEQNLVKQPDVSGAWGKDTPWKQSLRRRDELTHLRATQVNRGYRSDDEAATINYHGALVPDSASRNLWGWLQTTTEHRPSRPFPFQRRI